MDEEGVEGYRPPPEFVEDVNEPLIDLKLADSTELWLLQLPFAKDSLADIDGQELPLKLHHDGQLASFEGSSGEVYDFVSLPSQEPDATVFVSSTLGPKIAGKVSRRVSIVHYPDPKELENVNSNNARQAYHNSTGITITSSQYFPMQSKLPSAQSGHAALTQGSRHKSSLSVGEPLNTPKRRRVSESIMSEDKSYQKISNGRHSPELSRGHSSGISIASSERSRGGRSKKKN